MNELRERIPHTWPSSYENYSWNLFLVLLRRQFDASRLRQATTTMKTLLFTVRVRTMFMTAGKPNWYKSYSKYVLSLRSLSHYEAPYEAPMYPGRMSEWDQQNVFSPFWALKGKKSCRSKRLYFLSGSIFDWQMTKKNEPRELRPMGLFWGLNFEREYINVLLNSLLLCVIKQIGK